MAENDQHGVIITNKDIYTEVLKMKEALSAMIPQAKRLDDHEERLRTLESVVPPDVEQRVRSIERWKYAMPASIGAGIVSIIQGILDGHHG